MRRIVPALVLLAALQSAWPVEAGVARVVVESRETAAEAPGYERLTGHFYGELDPGAAVNEIINDIQLAPRNAQGKVEYSAAFTLLRPANAQESSGVLWYEVPNRGNSPLNRTLPRDALRAGHVLVSSGWQGDLTPRADLETIRVPIARRADGSAITGKVLARLSHPQPRSTASLEEGFGGLHYQEPVSMDSADALLTRQTAESAQAIPIAAKDWAFANCENRPFPGDPDPKHICLRNGFEADVLYQVVYTAKDPLVLGIGLASIRDLVSFLRNEQSGADGAANPAAGMVSHTIAFGNSQSGNLLKTFLHLGFNADEQGRAVFDGLNPNIAARQTPINFRFAIPGGAANLYEPGSEGVLWWSVYEDEVRGLPAASLLDRCRASDTCPRIFETFGSSEFWGLRMSPGLVGTKADADIPLPPNVRRYYFPGVTHGGGRGGFTSATIPGRQCVLANNPNSVAETMRALRFALTEWVVRDVEPPPSSYPTLARGELVAPTHAAMGFPPIPGQPLPDNMLNEFPVYDFGESFNAGDLSGSMAIQPPIIRGWARSLAPRTDADGNEVGGVPSVLHQAPLGTYLGWNVAASGFREGLSCGFSGGFIPFAATKQERERTGDPRPSLDERYGTHERYVRAVQQAAQRLVQQRFLLPDDARTLVQEAEESDVLR